MEIWVLKFKIVQSNIIAYCLDDVCRNFEEILQDEEEASNHRECLISLKNNKMLIFILNVDLSVYRQFEYEESDFFEETQGSIDESYSFQVQCGTVEFLCFFQALRRMLRNNYDQSDVVGTISLTYEITSHDDTLMPCLRLLPNLGHDSVEISLDVWVKDSPADYTEFENEYVC